MALPTKTSLALYRGDTVDVVVQVWDDDDHTVPTDLSGTEINAQIRQSADAVDVVADFVVEVEGNTIGLKLDPKAAASLPPAAVFDVEIDWSNGLGDDIQTVVYGTIATTPDVTRVTPP